MSEIYEVISGISHKKFFVANKKTLAFANLHVANLRHEKFAQIYLTGIIWPNYCFILISKPMEVQGMEPGASHMQSARSTTELHPHFLVFPVVQ